MYLVLNQFNIPQKIEKMKEELAMKILDDRKQRNMILPNKNKNKVQDRVNNGICNVRETQTFISRNKTNQTENFKNHQSGVNENNVIYNDALKEEADLLKD